MTITLRELLQKVVDHRIDNLDASVFFTTDSKSGVLYEVEAIKVREVAGKKGIVLVFLAKEMADAPGSLLEKIRNLLKL